MEVTALSEETDRPRTLRAIKKCLSDAFDYFQDAMDELDEIGQGSVGPGMAPIVGGYALPNPKKRYRAALISIDSAEKALTPLLKRYKDGRVNDSHFQKEEALTILKDISEFEYEILMAKLSEKSGRESVWYRLREMTDKIERVFRLVSEQ
ncbi:MAG: hypothetical protein ACXAEF_03015 [Candidatus Thorarchaeota archaeon]